MQQAELADLDAPTLAALQHLVGSLDDRGFLTQSPADVALQTQLPLDAVKQAHVLLKAFEPPASGPSHSPSAFSPNSTRWVAATPWARA